MLSYFIENLNADTRAEFDDFNMENIHKGIESAMQICDTDFSFFINNEHNLPIFWFGLLPYARQSAGIVMYRTAEYHNNLKYSIYLTKKLARQLDAMFVRYTRLQGLVHADNSNVINWFKNIFAINESFYLENFAAGKDYLLLAKTKK